MPLPNDLTYLMIRLSSRPTVYGAFHIASLCIIIILFILMTVFRKHLPRGKSTLRLALALFGSGLLVLEIVKQLICSYDASGGWSYNWARFPFQFCSSPIYISLIAALLPDGKVRTFFLCFLGTYSPIAGCAVLFWPSPDVFSTVLFLDIHTMLWHGSMLLFGLYLWLSGAIEKSLKTAVRAFAVFLPLNFIALALNEAEHILGFAKGYEFNMFYISRYYTCQIPLLNQVQENAPYPVFFVSFILLLTFGNIAVTLSMMLIGKIIRRQKAAKG